MIPTMLEHKLFGGGIVLLLLGFALLIMNGVPALVAIVIAGCFILGVTFVVFGLMKLTAEDPHELTFSDRRVSKRLMRRVEERLGVQ